MKKSKPEIKILKYKSESVWTDCRNWLIFTLKAARDKLDKPSKIPPKAKIRKSNK